MKILPIVCVCLLVFGCASNNRPLQLIGGKGPTYPATAKSQGIEGSVTVRYDVSIDGVVQNATVVDSNPPGVFDAAALVAVQSWRFNPPVLEGVKQIAKNRESIVAFKLSGADAYDDY